MKKYFVVAALLAGCAAHEPAYKNKSALVDMDVSIESCLKELSIRDAFDVWDRLDSAARCEKRSAYGKAGEILESMARDYPCFLNSGLDERMGLLKKLDSLRTE